MVTTIDHYLKLDRIEQVFVLGHQLYGKVMAQLKVQTESSYGRLLVLFSIKAFGLPVGYTLFLMARIRVLEVRFQYDFIGQTSVVIISVVHSVVPSLFYAAMIWCFYLMREINHSLRRIMAGAEKLDSQLEVVKPFRSQHRFCVLSDRLDAVAVCHQELCQFLQKLERVANVPMTLWISFRCVCVLVEVFSLYMYLSGWLTRPLTEVLSRRLICVALGGGMLYATDLAMIANVCLVTKEEVRELAYCIHKT